MPSLELDRLSKSYGSVHALRELSFEVGAGEIFGFVGSNGAGKTTAMRITLGVLAADAGEVRWGGVPLDLEMRRRVGYMPEERGLYPKMKVAEQLLFFAELHGMSPADAREAVDRWTDRLGVGHRRRDAVEKLSLGNQQRVQLAAALVHDPVLLVLDEPFSGLDPVAVDVMSEVLRERAAAGVPVIFSSHQLDLVERLCDRVGIVSAGSMVATGSIDELRATGEAPWMLAWGERTDPVAVRQALAAVPGVTVQEVPGRGDAVHLLAQLEGAEQAALRAALEVGEVRSFARDLPTLTELFRDVVSAPADEEVAA